MVKIPRVPRSSKHDRTRRRAASFVANDTKLHFAIHGKADRSVVSCIISSIIRFITHELQEGRRVRFAGLGEFYLSHRKGHVIKEGVEHPEADYPMFKASKLLRLEVWKVRKPVWKNKSEII